MAWLVEGLCLSELKPEALWASSGQSWPLTLGLYRRIFYVLMKIQRRRLEKALWVKSGDIGHLPALVFLRLAQGNLLLFVIQSHEILPRSQVPLVKPWKLVF